MVVAEPEDDLIDLASRTEAADEVCGICWRGERRLDHSNFRTELPAELMKGGRTAEADGLILRRADATVVRVDVSGLHAHLSLMSAIGAGLGRLCLRSGATAEVGVATAPVARWWMPLEQSMHLFPLAKQLEE